MEPKFIIVYNGSHVDKFSFPQKAQAERQAESVLNGQAVKGFHWTAEICLVVSSGCPCESSAAGNTKKKTPV